MEQLQTKRLILREWRHADAPRLIEIAGQEHIEHWLSDWREFDKHAEGWIEWVRSHYIVNNPMEEFISWAVTLGDTELLIGQIGVGSFDALGGQECEIFYFMEAGHCCKGYMAEAVTAVAAHVFGAYGYDHVIATVQPDNLPSCRVVEKCGFHYLKTIEYRAGGNPTALPFRYYRLNRPQQAEEPDRNDERAEEMESFFNERADTYDAHMLDDLKLAEFYEAVADCFPAQAGTPALLDLGCGTGLELERLFQRCPGLRVTGVDLSPGMLKKLREKYPDHEVTTLQGSYFDLEYGEGRYDNALSTYSLHHFSEERKLQLFRKLHKAIKPGGRFVEGDYTVPTPALQEEFRARARQLLGGESADSGFYHCDTPFTAETEMTLLRKAGFVNVCLVRHWESTSLIVAERPDGN